MAFIKLTYYEPIYDRDVTVMTRDINFTDDGRATFTATGFKEMILISRIRKIEVVD